MDVPPAQAPASMTFEALPHLSYSKFRLHRRTFNSDQSVAGGALQPGQTATISCSAPSNWYLLGNRSKVAWESVLSGGEDATAFAKSGEHYRRMKYGPNAAWSRVTETVNSGALVVSRLDSASQSIGRSRGFLSRRAITQLYPQIGVKDTGLATVGPPLVGTGAGWAVGNKCRFDPLGPAPPSATPAFGTVSAEVGGVPTSYVIDVAGANYGPVGQTLFVSRTNAAPGQGGATGNQVTVLSLTVTAEVLDRSLEPAEVIINSLEASGCVNRGIRSKASSEAEVELAFSGFPYSVPLTAYSRVAQNDFVPVGLMSQFNPASAWQVEFTVAEVGDAAAVPVGVDGSPATNHQVFNLRMEAYFIEVLDSRVQEAIVAQFNREVIETPDGPLQLKLELPILGLSHQTYRLAPGTQKSLISIQSNSPSLRGICIIPRNSDLTGDGAQDAANIRWNSVLATAGGYCVMASPAQQEFGNRPDTLDSWLTSQREDAASLFSLYAPQRDAIQSASASQLLGLQGQIGVTIGSIALNFENADGAEIDQLRAARGLDMRNIGRLDVNLGYQQNLPGAAPANLDQEIVLDVLLVEDVLYHIGRDGVRDVTIFEFGA